MTDPQQPWLESRWQNGKIKSNANTAMKILIFIAVVWNAFSLPFFYFMITTKDLNSDIALVLVSMFLLVGFILAHQAAVHFLRWRRFGELVLQLDPFPGSLAGDVGGIIEVPLTYDHRYNFDISLDCVHIRVSRGSKSDSRSERVVWRERCWAVTEPSFQKTKIKFRFKIPPNLPASESPSRNFYQWQIHVHCELPGVDLQRTFIVPVFQTNQPLHTRTRIGYTPIHIDIVNIPERIAQFSRNRKYKRLSYPSLRNLRIGLTLSIFTAIWNGLFIFAGSEAMHSINGQISNNNSEHTFFLPILLFFGLVFGGIGLLLFLATLYTLFNNLDVYFYSDKVVSIRRVCGIPFKRMIAISQIHTLESKISSQNGQGYHGRIYYTLSAQDNQGKTITLGDGIPGTTMAKRLKQLISETLDINMEWTEKAVKRPAKIKRSMPVT